MKVNSVSLHLNMTFNDLYQLPVSHFCVRGEGM